MPGIYTAIVGFRWLLYIQVRCFLLSQNYKIQVKHFLLEFIYSYDIYFFMIYIILQEVDVNDQLPYMID